MGYSTALIPLLALAASAPDPKWVPLHDAGPPPSDAASAPAAQAPANAAPPEAPPSTAPAPQIAPPPQVGTGGPQQPLALTCMGAGTADKQKGSFVFGRWGWASLVSHHDRQFNDQVDVRLFTGDDRIRLPRTMLPGIHGGRGGWFRLTDVVADARTIDGHASVSVFHNPKVHIDRTTGTISISGKDGDYAGECQVIDASAPAKF